MTARHVDQLYHKGNVTCVQIHQPTVKKMDSIKYEFTYLPLALASFKPRRKKALFHLMAFSLTSKVYNVCTLTLAH